MKSKERGLSTLQKILILAAALIGLAGLTWFAWTVIRTRWTQPPCPTCHIENNSSLSGTRNDIGCFINGRISYGFTQGPVVAELDGVKTAGFADMGAPGFLANECVNIPVPCPPVATPKLEFSRIGFSDRWDNPLCVGDCPSCEE